MGYPLSDGDLTRRFERATVEDLIAFTASARDAGIYPSAETLRLGGGAALWLSEGNVVNGAIGLGMNGPVEREEVAALVAFFGGHGMPAKVDVCPLADPSLLRWLAEERFVATDFEMVLYQPLPAACAAEPAAGVSVRIASRPEERELWGDLEARGFLDERVSEADRALARALALRPDALPFLGQWKGEPCATGMLVMRDGLAMFNGDSTLPAYRGRGIQSALLAARLRHASEAGCDLALIEAAAGGISVRNQQRAGFRVAYNRVTLERVS